MTPSHRESATTRAHPVRRTKGSTVSCTHLPTTHRRRALILIPSGGDLPLAEPADVPSVSIGFFLVELAQVLSRFQDSHEFVLATPDGSVPQLDINGLALPYHALDELVATMRRAAQLQAAPEFDLTRYRAEFQSLVDRRESEIKLLEGHLGRVRLSDVLPGTDRDGAALHPELTTRLSRLPAKEYRSAADLVHRHRDPDDDFDLGAFDFIHAPGGHAPMISFRDDPWLGEILHVARERGVLLSLICHAPVILTSTRFRVDDAGQPYPVTDNPFAGSTVSTVPQAAERASEDHGYLHVPGRQTRLTYYIDQALEQAGIHNLHKPNPATVLVHEEPGLRVLSTNGPHGVDALAERIAQALVPAGAGA